MSNAPSSRTPEVRPSTPAPILELRSVAKAFAGHAAVRGITESFGAGEYVCILGASGCGKTTLLRLIAGFESPDAGDIVLEGQSVVAVPPERRNDEAPVACTVATRAQP